MHTLSYANHSKELEASSALHQDSASIQQLAETLSAISKSLVRIADHFDPPPPDKVGTRYIADRLGCTIEWVSQMADTGRIPPSCVIPGTGGGKPWKFLRSRIDEWIESR